MFDQCAARNRQWGVEAKLAIQRFEAGEFQADELEQQGCRPLTATVLDHRQHASNHRGQIPALHALN